MPVITNSDTNFVKEVNPLKQGLKRTTWNTW